jgi:hypothetical protein
LATITTATVSNEQPHKLASDELLGGGVGFSMVAMAGGLWTIQTFSLAKSERGVEKPP